MQPSLLRVAITLDVRPTCNCCVLTPLVAYMVLMCWQITDGKNEDWLRDRWQAAKDMTGKPIDGKQWVMLDLTKRAQITRLVLGTL